MSVQAILFDLDDTLYSYQETNCIALEKVYKFLVHTLTLDIKQVRAAVAAARSQVHHDNHGIGASHSRLLYFQKAIESLTNHTDCQLTLQCEELFGSTFLIHMKIFPNVIQCLDFVKSCKLKLAIITDLTTQIQLRKLIQLQLDQYVDFVVTSEEAGAEKPSARIFSLALQKLNLKPNQVVMIGDNFEKDCLGAKAAGIKNIIWKSQNASVEDIQAADSFLEITEILRTVI